MYHKWQSYDVWFLRYGMQRTESFVFLERFLLFHSPNPENKNFEKIKITPGDVIILHMCTINNNHKMCGSCDIEGNKHNSLSFWTIFYPFTPLLIQKINILKKWKKNKKKIHGHIILLQKSNKNHDHMLHCSWDVVCGRCSFYFSCWAIFCPFTPLTTQKI